VNLLSRLGTAYIPSLTHQGITLNNVTSYARTAESATLTYFAAVTRTVFQPIRSLTAYLSFSSAGGLSDTQTIVTEVTAHRLVSARNTLPGVDSNNYRVQVLGD
jgi:hypothetical protein